MKYFTCEDCYYKVLHLLAKRSIVFLMLIFAVTMGIFLLLPERGRGYNHDWKTNFLPIVLKPTIYNASTSDIYWETSVLPYPLAFAQAMTMTIGDADKEFLYLIGGGSVGLEQSRRVAYARINENGSLGEWHVTEEAENLWKLNGFSATAINELIYVLGGLHEAAGGDFILNNIAFCAKVNSDGSVESWERKANDWGIFSSNNPKYFDGVAYHSSVTIANRIYLIGGIRQRQDWYNGFESTNYIISAEVSSECDKLSWQQEPQGDILPKLRDHTVVAAQINANGQKKSFIYVIGGFVDGDPSNSVYRAEVFPDGTGMLPNETIDGASWTSLDPLPGGGLHFTSAVQSGDYLYVIGGRTANGTAVNTVYRAKIIDSEGNLSPWEEVSGLNKYLFGHNAVVSDIGRIYVTGGVTSTTSLVYDTVSWTPLLFLSKSNDSEDIVYPGEQITYNLTITSNNVRDIAVEDDEKIIITDTLPANLQFLSGSTIFTQNGQLLTAEIPALLINQEARLTYTAEILPQASLSSNHADETSASTVLPQTNVAATPMPTASTVYTVTNLEPSELATRPTIPPGCVKGGDVVILSGTPRPKPTCTPTPPGVDTPTPVISATATLEPTQTATPTPTNPPTPTPTPTSTPVPLPVLVANQATVCIGFEQERYCTYASAVNAPFRTYLPIILKE